MFLHKYGLQAGQRDISQTMVLQGINTVLTVAAGPGSIQGEKNTHAEAMPVLGSRKNSSANDF